MNRPATTAPAAKATALAPLPEPIAAWARAHLGDLVPWVLPLGVDGVPSWRASAGGRGLVDIRWARTDEGFRREVFAHRRAVPLLHTEQAPRLLAAEPRLRTLLVLQPRAQRVAGSPLATVPRIHEQAGRLLRAWHLLGDHLEQGADTAARHVRQYTDRHARLLDEPFTAWLGPGDSMTIHDCIRELTQHAPQLPHAYAHGVFGPAVWQWAVPETLTFTHFGQARLLPAVLDFARPALLWADEPDLADAFTRGFGRPLIAAERSVLAAVSVLAALDDLHHALHIHNDEARRHAREHLRLAVRRYCTWHAPAPSAGPDKASQSAAAGPCDPGGKA
ncbi:hypothetical protein ACIBUY_03570 [Streptomyces sp. NPDC050085]|uniref:hypothetical protein n=1 Tax=Streptomyces sp. NPDC050085 TaxID=3365600 RepID=UPI0037AE15C5